MIPRPTAGKPSKGRAIAAVAIIAVVFIVLHYRHNDQAAAIQLASPIVAEWTEDDTASDLAYWTRFVEENAPEELKARCREVINGGDGYFSQVGQEQYIFHNFVKHRRGPGVYLDLGANDPILGSNTVFFDRCLQWKGVCVEPNMQYQSGFEKHRTCRLVPNCVSFKDDVTVKFIMAKALGHIAGPSDGVPGVDVVCKSLVQIFKENADILGGPDVEGKYGATTDFVSLDIEGHEPQVVACTDLAGLLSREANQAWVIENSRTKAPDLRTLDMALTHAGFIKTQSLTEKAGSFLDDVYVLQPRKSRPFLAPHMRCKGGKPTCAAMDILLYKPDNRFASTVNCA